MMNFIQTHFQRLPSAAAVICIISTFFSFSAPVFAQQTPLVMEGKTVLFQRVLTRPASQVWSEPGDASQPAKDLPPFTPFYVYSENNSYSEEWIQIGNDSVGTISGWVPAASVIEWKHAISIAFTNPANRERLPFFKSDTVLENLVSDEKVVSKTQEIVDTLKSGLVGPDYLAIALEPETHVYAKKNFYLLPILDFSDALNYDFLEVRMLKVASASVHEEILPTAANPVIQPVASAAVAAAQQIAVRQPAAQQAAQQPATQQLGQTAQQANAGVSQPATGQVQVAAQVPLNLPKSGIAFVIDTTTSMGPYIESLRAVIGKLNDNLGSEGLLDSTSFAMVGYRDNTQVAPGLDYVSRVFADFRDGKTPDDFLKLAADVDAASTSSQNFTEDVYAGVLESISTLDWTPFSGRFVVLVGDAGPRLGSDPLSKTKLGSQELNRLAREKGIAVMALHLKTPSGRNNHEQAEQEFLTLTAQENIDDLYYSIDAGDVNQFNSVLEEVSLMLVDLISVAGISTSAPALVAPASQPAQAAILTALTGTGQTGTAPVQTAPATGANTAQTASTQQQTQQAQPAATAPTTASAAKPVDPAKARFLNAIRDVGVAMQLAYLGRLRGDVPPSVFEAWVADRDLINPKKKAIDVRLLLTKAQLSNLQDALKTIVREGQMGQIAPDEFFDRLKSASAALSTDPARFNATQFQTIGDIDILNELLGDLPYKSKIMNISQRDWLSFSIGEQEEFVANLISKIRLYQEFHDDVDNWEDFEGELPASEAVYPVPLDVLP